MNYLEYFIYFLVVIHATANARYLLVDLERNEVGKRNEYYTYIQVVRLSFYTLSIRLRYISLLYPESSFRISCGSKVCTGSQKCCDIQSCEDLNSPILPDPNTWTCEETCLLDMAFCSPPGTYKTNS